jgi:myosin heavy subunit
MPPHVFGLAGCAYHNLLTTGANQSVILSGESGSGKTEASKLVLIYLMEMSRRAQDDSSSPKAADSVESLEEQTVCAQLILEAFGNAKTRCNDNASRFSKWVEVRVLSKSTERVQESQEAFMSLLPTVSESVSV